MLISCRAEARSVSKQGMQLFHVFIKLEHVNISDETVAIWQTQTRVITGESCLRVISVSGL